MDICPSLVIFFCLIIDNPTVVIDQCIARIYFNGLAIIRDSLGVVVLLLVGNPAADIGICIVGVYFNGLAKIRDGLR